MVRRAGFGLRRLFLRFLICGFLGGFIAVGWLVCRDEFEGGRTTSFPVYNVAVKCVKYIDDNG